MRSKLRPASAIVLAFVLALVTLATLPIRAQELPATESFGSTSITWTPLVPWSGAVLSVTGPDGVTFERRFAAGAPLSFRLSDLEAGDDGAWVYELRLAPVVDPATRAALEEARRRGDDDAMRRLRAAGKIPPEHLLAQPFTVFNGAIVPRGFVEEGGGRRRVDAGTQWRTENRPGPLGPLQPLDQVIADDLIVQGSACIGLDCVNNESFGFDTIRMKENNTRIAFSDTSTGAFPSTDWQLTANDSASGGANKFSIEDITSSRVPFTITGGATTNSLFVDSTGRVGLRTSTPVLDMHVNTSNTPAFRLEQNNSGGFTAQTWDVAGNEAGFFVRDVTSGSRLSFRIRPGAPTSSIDIAASGNVGIGTGSPSAPLHVLRSDGTAGLHVEETSGTAAARTLTQLSNKGAVALHVKDTSPATPVDYAMTLDGATSRMGIVDSTTASATKVGIGTTAPAATLHVAGDLIVDGAVTWGAPGAPAPTQGGVVAPASFSGSPAQATVILPFAFADSAYTVSLTPVSASGKLVFNLVSKSAGSFVVGTDMPLSDLVELDWLAIHP